jgi:hypothetical protein
VPSAVDREKYVEVHGRDMFMKNSVYKRGEHAFVKDMCQLHMLTASGVLAKTVVGFREWEEEVS